LLDDLGFDEVELDRLRVRVLHQVDDRLGVVPALEAHVVDVSFELDGVDRRQPDLNLAGVKVVRDISVRAQLLHSESRS
jgi:hypothetical protein